MNTDRTNGDNVLIWQGNTGDIGDFYLMLTRRDLTSWWTETTLGSAGSPDAPRTCRVSLNMRGTILHCSFGDVVTTPDGERVSDAFKRYLTQFMLCQIRYLAVTMSSAGSAGSAGSIRFDTSPPAE